VLKEVRTSLKIIPTSTRSQIAPCHDPLSGGRRNRSQHVEQQMREAAMDQAAAHERVVALFRRPRRGETGFFDELRSAVKPEKADDAVHSKMPTVPGAVEFNGSPRWQRREYFSKLLARII